MGEERRMGEAKRGEGKKGGREEKREGGRKERREGGEMRRREGRGRNQPWLFGMTEPL